MSCIREGHLPYICEPHFGKYATTKCGNTLVSGAVFQQMWEFLFSYFLVYI